MKRGRSRQFAVALVLGVTIVAGTGFTRSTQMPPVRRFLAVDNYSGRSLITVVTDASTSILHSNPLYAGLKVRVYGIRTGRTIRAQRIEVMR